MKVQWDIKWLQKNFFKLLFTHTAVYNFSFKDLSSRNERAGSSTKQGISMCVGFLDNPQGHLEVYFKKQSHTHGLSGRLIQGWIRQISPNIRLGSGTASCNSSFSSQFLNIISCSLSHKYLQHVIHFCLGHYTSPLNASALP